MAKKTIQQMIIDLRKITQELSLNIVEKMSDGEVVEPDELKHVNEMKKHLKFAETVQKQIDLSNGVNTKSASKSVSLSSDMVHKIKQLQKSVGDIVRTMPIN